jgi:hypothetical protein
MQLLLCLLTFITLCLYVSEVPVVFSVALILYALLVAGVTWGVYTKWVRYAVTLIFLGGIIVVFIYASTITSSQKFKARVPSGGGLLVGLIVFGLPCFFYAPARPVLSSLYTPGGGPVLLFLVGLLVLTLVLVVKITQPFKGALTKSF